MRVMCLRDRIPRTLSRHCAISLPEPKSREIVPAVDDYVNLATLPRLHCKRHAEPRRDAYVPLPNIDKGPGKRYKQATIKEVGLRVGVVG